MHTISEWHEILCHHQITPTYVFDGSQHPMKHETNAERVATRQKAEQELLAYYEKGRSNQVTTNEDHGN